jgi:uncharacterized protein YbjT (DUF2867 family)
MAGPTLVVGATGFVGQRLVQALRDQGRPLRCTSRSPERAREAVPDVEWVRLDLNDPQSLDQALEGASSAVYLVHLMASGEGYAAKERAGALAFRLAAERAGLERVVYLGGVAPNGQASDHLKSRLDTGEVLRGGELHVLELRAGMIIGAGSASWNICRDLSARLPLMVLPKWMKSRSQPVAIDDVVAALVGALDLPLQGSQVYELPGREVLTAKEILIRAAAVQGLVPRTVEIPVITPTLSSYWLKLVSGADYMVARELVHGLVTDLLPTGPSIWEALPGREPMGFDEAVREALATQEPRRGAARLVEAVARRLSRSPEE